MFAVFAVEPRNSNAIRNELQGFGDLCYMFRISGGRLGWDFEIWELEFETPSPHLLGRVLRCLDSWGGVSSVLAEMLDTDYEELHDAVAASPPTRPSLTWCVRRYLAYYPVHWQTYWTASGKCGVVSENFLSFLRRYGAVSEEQLKSGYARVAREYRGERKHASADFPTEVHEVVAIGRIRIDYTRRQYDETAPVPTAWISRTDKDNVFPPSRP